jgi:hypothetical protein
MRHPGKRTDTYHNEWFLEVDQIIDGMSSGHAAPAF